MTFSRFDMDEYTTDADIEDLRTNLGRLNDHAIIEDESIEYTNRPVAFKNKYFRLYLKIHERLGLLIRHDSMNFMDIAIDYWCDDICYTLSGRKITVGFAERITISNPIGDRLFMLRFDEPVLEKIREANKIIRSGSQTARLQFTYDLFQVAFVARVDCRDLARRRITVAATSQAAADALATCAQLFL